MKAGEAVVIEKLFDEFSYLAQGQIGDTETTFFLLLNTDNKRPWQIPNYLHPRTYHVLITSER